MTVGALLGFAARAALFALALVAVGAAAFRWLIHPRAVPDPATEARAARVGLASAALLLPVLALSFLAQLLEFRDPFAPLAGEVALLLSLPWGSIWWLQVGIAALLAAALSAAVRGGRVAAWAWSAAAALAVALCFTPAMNGHAAAAQRQAPVAIAADGVHVLAAGCWLGTLFVLGAVSLRGERPPAEVLLARLTAFSPVALVSATLVALTGTIGAWIHLQRFDQLWTSPYGRLLSVKLALFGLVVALGAFNWRRAAPRLRREDDRSLLARSITAELGVTALLILVTAWFVATSPPEP